MRPPTALGISSRRLLLSRRSGAGPGSASAARRWLRGATWWGDETFASASAAHPRTLQLSDIGGATCCLSLHRDRFDAVDDGGLDDSWRQQPGTPAYGADLAAEALRETLARTAPERPTDFRAAA
jgi:hypothetical protein